MSPAELADWRAKAAAIGVPLSHLLRQAMARTRTWTAAAAEAERERTRQVARIGNNLNQLARWANRHVSAVEAVEVIANLVAFERECASRAPRRIARSLEDVPGDSKFEDTALPRLVASMRAGTTVASSTFADAR